MRFLYTIIFLMAFPVLLLLFRQEFLDRLQAPLAAQAAAALARPEFAGVRAELNYVDVSLRGQVAQPAMREKARAALDAIPGLRCREEDNHLQVHPAITGTLAETRLALSGWLHSSRELEDIMTWIEELRPGLEVDRSQVQFVQHVVPEPISSVKEMPNWLRQLHEALQADASLKVVRKDGTFSIGGDLPTIKLRQAIVLAVPLGEGITPLDFSGLHAGPYVTPAPFADEEALPRLLSVFLTSPGAQSIEARGQELLIRGHATPSTRDRWMEVLGRFPEQITIIAGFQVYPSVYHFPSYQPESPLPADKLGRTRQALGKLVIQFEKDAYTAAPSQAAALDDLAATIREAGPALRIVAGAVPTLDESADISRQRADSVISELVARGVPTACLEPGVFEPVSSAEESVPRVELLVK